MGNRVRARAILALLAWGGAGMDLTVDDLARILTEERRLAHGYHNMRLQKEGKLELPWVLNFLESNGILRGVGERKYRVAWPYLVDGIRRDMARRYDLDELRRIAFMS
jgi:hypothetical protein